MVVCRYGYVLWETTWVLLCFIGSSQVIWEWRKTPLKKKNWIAIKKSSNKRLSRLLRVNLKSFLLSMFSFVFIDQADIAHLILYLLLLLLLPLHFSSPLPPSAPPTPPSSPPSPPYSPPASTCTSSTSSSSSSTSTYFSSSSSHQWAFSSKVAKSIAFLWNKRSDRKKDNNNLNLLLLSKVPSKSFFLGNNIEVPK